MDSAGTWMGLLGAFFGMVNALGVLVVTLRVFRPMKKTIETTHTIVNQQRTDMQNLITWQKQQNDRLKTENDKLKTEIGDRVPPSE